MAALSGACDQGKQHDQKTRGPLVSVVAANIGSGKPLPVDGVIEIGFDRLLNPLTVTRQTVQLRDAFDQAVDPPPLVQYDPVARVVTLANSAIGTTGPTPWLKLDQPYTVTLPIATGEDDTNGIRAIDRATLNPASTSLKIGFNTVRATGFVFNPLPKSNFCRDILPIFQRSCSAAICHGNPRPTSADVARFGDGGTRPAAGLVLQYSSGVANTAISRVANGSNTGAFSGDGVSPGRLFGVDMPLIKPGEPANSWLLYKVMLAPPADATTFTPAVQARCDQQPGTPPQDFAPASFETGVMDDVERSILSDYVLGREMPYPDIEPAGVTNTNPGLTFQELERLRSWIQQGADVPECGACAK